MRICEDVTQHIGELFTCTEVNGFTRIRTPYTYPDGDLVDVFLKEADNDLILTDLGETLGRLRLQQGTLRRTQKQNNLLHEVCQAQGIELHRGMLMLRLPTATQSHEAPENLDVQFSWAMMRLTQAILQISSPGLAPYHQRQHDQSPHQRTKHEVITFLNAQHIEAESDHQMMGRSKRRYKVDIYTHQNHQQSLIYILSHDRQNAAKNRVNQVFAAWSDLVPMENHQDFPTPISLIDDRVPIWLPEDYRLLERVSSVVHWSQPSELTALLNCSST